MKNFNNDRGSGGFKRKEWTNDRPAQLFKATCAECGKTCDVPFRPTGDKPVYCNDCFSKKRDGGDGRPSRDYGAPKSFAKRDFGARDARPSYGDRPAYADRSERPSFKPDNTGKQLSEISMKLDRLIVAMEKMSAPKALATYIPEAKTTKAIPANAIVKASKPKTAKKKAEAKPKKKAAKKK